MMMTVATTILEQLGGNRFRAMTGARDFVGDADSLAFKLPSRFAKDGINVVKIKLDPSDTYTVTFSKLGRAPKRSLTVVAELSDIYADSLQSVFKSHTGLDTHL
jgi:hypothetical protein